MNLTNPILLLGVFLVITLLLYYFFRPFKGWFYILKNSSKSNSKIAVEDILKLLYHSQESGNSMTVNDLTNTLNYSNDLLVDNIEKMTKRQLLYVKGDRLKLSESGNCYALRIIRAHRLWEKFLSEKTGFSKKEWHQRAEKKEHELSQGEVNKLAQLLGNPKFDPHGDPIPTNAGKMVLKKGIPLSELAVNTVGKIIHIEDEPDVIYRQILAEKIHLDSQIRVIQSNIDRIIFHCEGEEFILAPIVAGNITVLASKQKVICKESIVRLSVLEIGETAKVTGISKECRGENRRRLLDLGFVKGAIVKIDLLNPLKDPKAFLIKGTTIALRANQATNILIKKD